jgi:hypothetical protein
MNTFRKLLICLCVVAIVSAIEFQPSKAQIVDWVAANGAYTGSIGMDGKYKIPAETFGGAAGAEIDWIGFAFGPLEIFIDGGDGEGDWELEGDAYIEGTFPVGGGTASIEGNQIFGGDGVLFGSFTQFTAIPISELLNLPISPVFNYTQISMDGESYSAAEITLTFQNQTNTQSAEMFTEDVNMFLYYQAVSCTQIMGGWIEPAEQRLEDSGIRPEFFGDWYVIRDDALSDETGLIEEGIDALLTSAIQLKTRISDCGDIRPNEIGEFLTESHKWLDSLQKDLSCEYTDNKFRYLLPVSYAACTTIAAYWNNSCPNYEPLTTDQGIIALSAIGLGCFGQGFFDDEALLALSEEQMISVLSTLDFNNQADIIIAEKIMDVAYTLGLDDLVEFIVEMMNFYIESDEGG